MTKIDKKANEGKFAKDKCQKCGGDMVDDEGEWLGEDKDGVGRTRTFTQCEKCGKRKTDIIREREKESTAKSKDKMTLAKWKQIGRICGYDGTRTASTWGKDADRLRKACSYKMWKMVESQYYGDRKNNIKIDPSDVKVRIDQIEDYGYRFMLKASIELDEKTPEQSAKSASEIQDVLDNVIVDTVNNLNLKMVGGIEYKHTQESPFRSYGGPKYTAQIEVRKKDEDFNFNA